VAPSSRFTKSSKKATKLEALRVAVDAQSNHVIEENPMRTDFGEKFQALIDDYNSGSRNIEQLFEQLLKLSQSLSDEQRRCVHVGVTQDELVIFEILTRPSPALSSDERDLVKKVAKRMLDRVKELLVIDWRSKQQPRAGIMLCIEDELDELPDAYSKEIYQQKCSAVFQHVYQAFPQAPPR